MTAKIFKPNSNWHRLVHLLDRNGGTLYLAQLYKPHAGEPQHTDVITEGMPKLTEYSLIGGQDLRYEKVASRMGWVNIQRHRNRVWVTLLPKGRTILKAFTEGNSWNRIDETPVKPLKSVHITIQL